MVRPIYDYTVAYTGSSLGEAEDDPSDPTSTNIAILLCNVSTVAFFTIELFYASYILYKLLFKNEKSRSLILSTLMIIYSCISLSVLFCIADEDYYAKEEDWDFG